MNTTTKSKDRPRKRPIWPTLDKYSFLLVFLGLPIAIYIAFVIVPFAQAFYFSLTDWGGFSPNKTYIGLKNYEKLLDDKVFMQSVRNSVALSLVLPPLTILISFAFASLVTVGGGAYGKISGLRFAGFYRIISFFPYVVPAIAIGIVWAQIYDPSNGLLNGFLTTIGLTKFESFAWLGEQSTAFGASVFVIVWSLVGFYMLLFIAAIKSIPQELFEAARLDGAGRFRTATALTLPMIRTTLISAYIYLGILALDGFVYMQALNPSGGPGNSTLVIAQQLLTTAFNKGQFGYASAMGVILAVVTLGFAVSVFVINALLKKYVRRLPMLGSPRVEKAVTASRQRTGFGAALLHIPLVAWVIIILAPMLWVVVTSFKTTKEIFASPFSLPADIQTENYVNAWTTAGVGNYFFNTIIVVGSALFLVMLLGAMCAYVLARMEHKLGRVIYYLMLAGLTFPIFLAIVPLFFMLKNFGLLNTMPGLIIVYVAFALPFTVFFLYDFFKELPGEIAEAAILDGAGHWRTFALVMLPMAKPGLASVAIFNFLGLWNQFLLPVALNTNRDNYVLSQGMANFASQAGYAVDFGALFAAVVITVLPVLAIYLLFQRQLQGSVTRGALK